MNKGAIIGISVAIAIGIIAVVAFSGESETEIVAENNIDTEEIEEETPKPVGRDLSVNLYESVSVKTP